MSEPTPEQLFEQYASEGFSGDAAAVGRDEFIAAIRAAEQRGRLAGWEEARANCFALVDLCHSADQLKERIAALKPPVKGDGK